MRTMRKCKDCINDLGYKAGMFWPPYKRTCALKTPCVTWKKYQPYYTKKHGMVCDNCPEFLEKSPVFYKRIEMHMTDSEKCWCNPEVETDMVTGNKVIVHKDVNH